MIIETIKAYLQQNGWIPLQVISYQAIRPAARMTRTDNDGIRWELLLSLSEQRERYTFTINSGETEFKFTVGRKEAFTRIEGFLQCLDINPEFQEVS